MSYERYKDFRLAPDDNGCWDVLDKEYQRQLTFPSKAAAKRWIDTQVFDNAQPEYTVQINPQDIFVKFEIWVKPKDNYRELEKMLGRLLDAWVTDLKPSDSSAMSGDSKSPTCPPNNKEGAAMTTPIDTKWLDEIFTKYTVSLLSELLRSKTGAESIYKMKQAILLYIGEHKMADMTSEASESQPSLTKPITLTPVQKRRLFDKFCDATQGKFEVLYAEDHEYDDDMDAYTEWVEAILNLPEDAL